MKTEIGKEILTIFEKYKVVPQEAICYLELLKLGIAHDWHQNIGKKIDIKK